MTNGNTDLIKVRNNVGYLEFQGEVLSSVSTESDTLPRWTEMTLYKVTDGTNRYVLCTIGRSVIYHVHEGACNSGVRVTGDKLSDDAEPCFKCKPVDVEELSIDELCALVVDMEEDRHSAFVCDEPEDVVAKLRASHTTKTIKAGTISGPGQRLLASAALLDERIKSTITAVTRL